MKRISITLVLAAALTIAPASIALASDIPYEGTTGPVRVINPPIRPVTWTTNGVVWGPPTHPAKVGARR